MAIITRNIYAIFCFSFLSRTRFKDSCCFSSTSLGAGSYCVGEEFRTTYQDTCCYPEETIMEQMIVSGLGFNSLLDICSWPLLPACSNLSQTNVSSFSVHSSPSLSFLPSPVLPPSPLTASAWTALFARTLCDSYHSIIDVTSFFCAE